FAKHHQGDFILRVEDTDQTRFVPGAEEYIMECLKRCSLNHDVKKSNGVTFDPCRICERKSSYRKFAKKLITKGYAYYAFDTAQELDEQRKIHPNFRYAHDNRMNLRNSLSLSEGETKELLDNNTPHTIRIKMPEEGVVS